MSAGSSHQPDAAAFAFEAACAWRSAFSAGLNATVRTRTSSTESSTLLGAAASAADSFAQSMGAGS